MPVYEYHCKKCDEVFEVKQRITEEPLETHDGCGGEVERLISRTSFVLKGTGWYKTDYASGGSDSSSKGDGEANGGSCCSGRSCGCG